MVPAASLWAGVALPREARSSSPGAARAPHPRPALHLRASLRSLQSAHAPARLELCPAAGLAGLLVQAPPLGRGQWSAAVRAHQTLSQPRRALPRPPASQPSAAQLGRDPGHPADGETPDSKATLSRGQPPAPTRTPSAVDCRLNPNSRCPPWTACSTQGSLLAPTSRTPPTGTAGVQPQRGLEHYPSHCLSVAMELGGWKRLLCT